jgi:hypothetical protein
MRRVPVSFSTGTNSVQFTTRSIAVCSAQCVTVVLNISYCLFCYTVHWHLDMSTGMLKYVSAPHGWPREMMSLKRYKNTTSNS